jgi:hypothetical protein
MSFWKRWTGGADGRAVNAEDETSQRIDEDLSLGPLAQDPVLQQALKDFRMSVHAWSEAELSRNRAATQVVRQRSWRLAAGVALGCVLVAGGIGGGAFEHHHRQEVARMAQAAQAAQQRRLLAEQKAREEEEDLLAKVDSDVSREVPSAMEPLAQLMDDTTR